ncbi:Mediator complex subunit Med5 family protein [Candida albicans]|uniref:Mediator of RNA polymerase II transcription subunit 5 n=1 Tax=Candida albicans TaxID=5476 RepID=A0A8H6BWW9_CANAX|nr:Mediator complex subunit Med5 family protein [Candida albicans]
MCDNLVNTEPTNCDNDDRIIIDNYNNLMIDWVNALFDDRNEGLSDELIKSLNIKQIYKIIPIIYRQGIIDTNNKKINWEILNNGLEYLSQPFLTPIIPIIIKSLLRDFTIDNDLKFKIIRELIKDNNNNSNNIIIKMVINICGNEILTFNPPADIRESIIKTMVYLDKSDPIARDINFKEFIKHQLLGDIHIQIEENFLNKYILNNRLNFISNLIEEIYNFQKFNHEDSKIYINLMIFIMLLDSIETKSDKDYWKKNFNLPYPMNLETNDSVVVVAVDSRFELSMDNHYSSIFNDDSRSSSSSSSSSSNSKDVDNFLKNGDEDEDEFMKDDNNTNNNNNNNGERITTSQQLEKLNEKIHRHECLLNEFRKIRTNTTETNLFAKSIRLLNDKLIEKITNWII